MSMTITRIMVSVLTLVPVAVSVAQTNETRPAAKPERIWHKANFPDTESCEAIVFDPQNPQRIVLGTRPGGLWESLDAGATWSRLKTIMPSALRYGFNPGSIVAHPRVKDLWFAGVEANGAYRSRDGGRTWKQISTGLLKGNQLNGISFTFDAKDDAIVFYGADGGLFKSTDNGDRWTKCTRGLPNGGGGNTTVSRLATDSETGALYAAFYAVGKGEQPGIYKSTDRGETWQAINHGIETGPDEEMIKAMKAQSKRLAGEKTDASLMADASTNDKAWSFDLQMSPANPKLLFAAMYRVLYRTDDAGERWHKCDRVSLPRSVAFHPKDPRIVAASGWQTIWISRDAGVSWHDISTGLNDPPKPAKPPKIIDLGNGLKGQFSEKTDIFTPGLLAFDPAGERLFALTTQGLWVATLPIQQSKNP